MSKPKLLLLADVRWWAFDQNLQDMAEYCSEEFDFSFAYVGEWGSKHHLAPSMQGYDVVFSPYHRWEIEHLLPMARTLGSLRAQWMFPERKRSPEQKEFDVVNSYAGYHVVTAKNYTEYHPHCPRVVYLTNPVNTRRFREPTSIVGAVVVEWNGNARHDNLMREDVKGFMSIIQPACRKAGIPIVAAEYNTSRRMPKDMPAFYRQANVAVCASLYEGASNSTMEAMASGLALITTDVGNHREMYESQMAAYGESGIMLVDRSVDAFAKALASLKAFPKLVTRMGDLNRQEIQRAWSWDVWAERYAAFLRTPLQQLQGGTR